MIQLKQHRRKIDSVLAEYRLAKRMVKQEESALLSARELIEHVTQSQQLVQAVAEHVQNQAHVKIASVVTRCLQTVFGDEAYQFRIRFSQKRGKTEAELVFVRDGVEIDEPMDASGGGVIDVASFALRLACLVLARPKRRLLLCLDEPFKMLSKDHIPAVRHLLESLAKEMKLQMVVVTHNTGLTVGKVIEL